MKRIMIDIETLGREPGCTIISIGGVPFSGTAGPCFYSLADWKNSPFPADPATVHWWLQQSAEALGEIKRENGLPIEAILKAFTLWIRSIEPDEIWADISFDLPILKHAMKAFGITVPWSYGQERDYRTVRKWFRLSTGEAKHHALLDARAQAEVIEAIEDAMSANGDLIIAL